MTEEMPDHSTSQDAKLLAELAELDARLDQLASRREGLGVSTGHAEALRLLEEARGHLGDLERRLKDCSASQAGLNKELARLRERAGSIRARLYAKGTPPRELNDLQEELAAVEMQISEKEDELLLEMEQEESLLPAIESAKASLSQLGEETSRREEALRQEQALIDQQALALLRRREELSQALSSPLRLRYQALRRRLGGQVVAMVKSGRCSACNIELSAQDKEEASHSRGAVLTCESCGRILIA